MMRRRLRKPVQIGAVALALALLFWGIGLWRFASAIPESVADPDQPTDAIVVLTGGSLRVAGGLKLLAAGKAKKLFVSGVSPGVDVAELLRVSRQSPESVTCCIALGHSADNTAGNARETAQWMASEGFRSLRLVTASYHMPRSLLEFMRAMPDKAIVPNPVFPQFLRGHPWWSRRASVVLIISEYCKYLVALVRPLLPASLLQEAGG